MSFLSLHLLYVFPSYVVFSSWRVYGILFFCLYCLSYSQGHLFEGLNKCGWITSRVFAKCLGFLYSSDLHIPQTAEMRMGKPKLKSVIATTAIYQWFNVCLAFFLKKFQVFNCPDNSVHYWFLVCPFLWWGNKGLNSSSARWSLVCGPRGSAFRIAVLVLAQ